MKITKRYVNKLSCNDFKKQIKDIDKSKRLYKKGVYFTRPKMDSFVSKESKHVKKAKYMYKIKSIKPSKNLAQKTGCHINGLKQIVSKGKGAYYSSGSRPSQTSHSWGVARLASSITGGKSSGVDKIILQKYCKKNSKVLKLAKTHKQGLKPTNKMNKY